jgi:hypothetical protein
MISFVCAHFLTKDNDCSEVHIFLRSPAEVVEMPCLNRMKSAVIIGLGVVCLSVAASMSVYASVAFAATA